MMRSLRSLPKVLLLAVSVPVLLFAIGACGNGSNVLEPLSGPPTSGSTISGVVRSQTGEALANVVVTLEPTEQGITASVRAQLAAAADPNRGVLDAQAQAAAGVVRSVVSDAQGRFAFASVGTGDYLLTGARKNHMAGLQRVSVTPASPAAVQVDIVLTPTGSLYGVATLENANTHQSTVVYVEGTSYVAVTNPSGQYVLSGVPMGTWTIRSTHPHYIDDSAGGTIAAAGDSIAVTAMLLRLESNIAPVATVGTPTGLFVALPIDFTGSASDADGSVVLYEWDFENDGVFEYSSGVSAATTHTYETPGQRYAKLRVTDNLGAIGLAAVSVNVSDAIYVSATTGSPGNPGTKLAPVNTLAIGFTKAALAGLPAILVADGTYAESPAFVNGVSVFGGWNPATWTRTLNRPVFTVGTTEASANSITSVTTIDQIRLNASNGVTPSEASIALRVANSSSNLTFSNCYFQAGNGAAGAAGASAGTAGLPGGNGSSGQAGSCDLAHGLGGAGGSSPVGCTGGSGGRGGLEGANAGVPGSAGLCGGGTGGFGGPGGSTGAPGGTGNSGIAGSNGAHGVSGSATGSTSAGIWIPAASTAGTAGSNGTAGGGGGGGGGQGSGLVDDGGGNGGGGGGGAGQGGGAGLGGFGGGASIAVLLYISSPRFESCTFQSGAGGAGGAGRNGAIGGAGGSGGAGAAVCVSEVGRGGNGGSGGVGGSGGAGAGGPGGPSYCVLRSGGSTPTIVGSTFILSVGGVGGAGGTTPGVGSAPNGTTGATSSNTSL